MDTHHDSRAGPGAQKVEQGPPSKAALPPDQLPSRDAVFLYATPSAEVSPTSLSAGLTDTADAGYDGASGGAPEPLPGSTDTGWYEVDGIRARVVIVRAPDGGRLSRFIQDLLLDVDLGGPPPDDHDRLSGVREPVPVFPHSGGSAVAVAVAVPDGDREPVLV